MHGQPTDKDLLEKTIELWQPHYDTTLSLEDVKEIVSTMSSFFELLQEWDQQDE